MSQLGWVDFSSNDREKVKNVLAMQTEPGTLDELGIGQIRDAFSDLLFPGISTIQTRAKYFIIVPRILRDYQAFTNSKKRSHQSLENYLSIEENLIAKTLVEIHDDNEFGIIGRTRINSGGVDRRPSVVYWNGLRVFGIVTTKLSLAEFCRQLDVNEHQGVEALSDHNEDSDDIDALKNKNIIQLPDQQTEWASTLKINLTLKEAEFLKRKMSDAPDIGLSVSAQLFNCELLSEALKDNANEKIESIDVLSELLMQHGLVHEICKQRIKLANEFSLAMEGPHILYNTLLAKKAKFNDSVTKYENEYVIWCDKVQRLNIFRDGCANEWLDLARWDNRHIKNKTVSFIEEWCQAMRDTQNNDALEFMVAEQAKSNKGGRSLLNTGVSQDQWVGIRRLDYRWSSAKRILKDIQEGLDAKP